MPNPPPNSNWRQCSWCDDDDGDDDDDDDDGGDSGGGDAIM